MALILETGSIVAGANTYVGVEDVRAYADARGLTLPEPDGDVEVLLVKAMDFLEAQEGRMQGARVDKDQELSWPRSGVTVNGFELGEDAIPKQLKNAQCQLACDAASTDLLPNGDGREVIREKVDVLETEYAKTGSSAAQPQLVKAEALLAPLLSNSGFSLTLEHV